MADAGWNRCIGVQRRLFLPVALALRARESTLGRVMLLALMVNYLAGRPLVGAYPWVAPVDSVVSWSLLLGLVLRWRQLRRQSAPDRAVPRGTGMAVDRAAAPDDEAARRAAGALGENIVADALAQLGHDHVVIHNLPLAGRGDVDHV